jgi:hypothetical protein
MRGFTFYSMVLATLFCVLSAQNAQAQGLKVGPRGGINLSTTSADASEAGFGYVAGATGEFGFLPFLYVQPELLFSQKGYENSFDNANLSQDITLGYLEVPLQLKVKILNKIFANAGVQVGFLLNDDVSFDDPPNNASDFEPDFNTIDFSIPVGVGYVLTSGKLGELQAEVRGNFSLSEAADAAEDGTLSSDDVDYQNRTYFLSIAWLIGL